MAGHGVGETASETLLERKEELARAITQALYAERPELLDRHGERGRRKCLQDMCYNLEHLAPAVALGEPSMFARYVVWLRDMLGARGVAADDIGRSLELISRVVREEFAVDEAAAVQEALHAGIAVLEKVSE